MFDRSHCCEMKAEKGLNKSRSSTIHGRNIPELELSIGVENKVEFPKTVGLNRDCMRI